MPGSDFVQSEIRKHLFRTGSFTKPSALFVSLHTADPTDAGTGTEVSATNTNYAREQRDPGDANWAASTATNGQTSNVADIEFNAPTAPGSGGVNWGTITHFAIWDAATGGNMIAYGPLATSRVVNAGDPAPKFSAGSLTVTII
jgi:hypothetical protein